MLWKNSIKFFQAGLSKVFSGQIRIFFQASVYETVKKMPPHELIVGYAVKGIVFHSIVLVELVAW